MRHQRGYLAALVQLTQLGEADERRAVWRQAIAALAMAVAEREPAPLEGFVPEQLLDAVRVAMADGLLEDLGFLSTAAGAVATYELAAALPPSPEKRELGRRVLKRLHTDDAATFTALATALAVTSKRPLHTGPIRARVSLVLFTPSGQVPGADELALALVARRDLEREWILAPSTGTLPARRVVARLIERAARQAARRLDEGDDSGIAAVTRPSVREAWERLLADRESLVWRHIAVARGLIAHASYGLSREIDQNLAPDADATGWRRAATSLAASLAREPQRVALRIRTLVAGDLVRRDPGVTRSLLMGLAAAYDGDPEIAGQLAAELIAPGGIDAVEALVELRRKHPTAAVEAAAQAQTWLRDHLTRGGGDDGHTALLQVLREELLDGPESGEGALGAALRAARDAVLRGDAGEALTQGRSALSAASDALDWLEQHDDDEATDRRHAYRLLRELDMGLLESGTLFHVLTLVAGDGSSELEELDERFDRLERWLLSRERVFDAAAGGAPGERPAHFSYRLARWRSLVRVLDAEVGGQDPGTTRNDRRLRTVNALLDRAQNERGALRRAVWAALMRGWDSLLRHETIELSDALLGLAGRAGSADDLTVLSEATMMPEVRRLLQASRDTLAAIDGARTNAGLSARRKAVIAAIIDLARSLPPATSARVEALRAALLRVARALERLSSARGLTDVPADAIERLELAIDGLVQLTAGARRRLGTSPLAASDRRAVAAIRALHLELERALRGDDGVLRVPTAEATTAIRLELPSTLAEVVAVVLDRLPLLPLERPAVLEAGDELSAPVRKPVEPVLPAWIPPSRVLGGFYIVRPLGFGAGGSVFVAVRAEARHAAQPEQFALKVPDYDGGAARQLSEDEFAQLFREEARALLAVPEHQNVASFVTFDAGAKPKPLLVMELVQGATLEQLMELRTLDTRAALAILDGIAAGLESMHTARVAHLDIKPANIILRGHDLRAGDASGSYVPVLVDFGLAGRKLRPGCGSPHFGAPEVWAAKLAAAAGTPYPADVYAFTCLTYELLTGEVLVKGDEVMAVVSAQVSGQGWREGVGRLAKRKPLSPLAELLQGGLQREAAARPTMTKIRAGLRALAPKLAQMAWPLTPV